ncbi:MAG: hypothetical protein ACREFL_21740 [Stellaceae bacterium]
MIETKARRTRGAADPRALGAALILLFLAACASSPPPPAPGSCIFATRGGVGLLCCPEPSGRQRCFLSRGGIEI